MNNYKMTAQEDYKDEKGKPAMKESECWARASDSKDAQQLLMKVHPSVTRVTSIKEVS